MNEHTQGKLSSLARRLEPFVTRWVHEILGEGRHTPLPGMTYIHGTGFPYIDESGQDPGRGRRTVLGTITPNYDDFQLNRDNDNEIVAGDAGYILGGTANKISWRSDGVVGGRGGYITDNVSWAMGNYFSLCGDGQTHWQAMFGEEYYGSPYEDWVPLYNYGFEDVLVKRTLLFNSYFAGHNVYDGTKCWHFLLDAVITWNGEGTCSVIWQNSTEIYSDGDDVDVRIAPSYDDLWGFEAYSTVYQGIRWFVHSRILEISF